MAVTILSAFVQEAALSRFAWQKHVSFRGILRIAKRVGRRIAKKVRPGVLRADVRTGTGDLPTI